MRKLNKKSYKGIDYIRLSNLSPHEAEDLRRSLSNRTLIKLLMHDVIVEDCVLYPAYDAWLKSYQPAKVEEVSPVLANSIILT